MNDIESGPNFFVHCEQPLMGSYQSRSIQEVDQKFEGGPVEFRKVLCKFAIDVRFQLKYLKNDKQRVTVVCSFHEEKGCKWRIHKSKEMVNGFFQIRKFEKQHTCGYVVCKPKHSCVTSSLVGELMEEKILHESLFKPVKVIGGINDRYGLDITYHHT